ncbi:MAG: hypothetical protein HPY44_01315 [Armatimonadetes bacterium]|nr:hypothetical protein [Armatimonadota bacterium]
MATHPDAKLVRISVILCGLLTWLISGQSAAQDIRQGTVRITLSPNPVTLPADGKSRSRILIEVRDRNEQPLPDGTPVFVFVDNGLVETGDADRRQSLTATTQGGYTTVYCTSETPGVATVTVRVQDTRQRALLTFLPKGESPKAQPRVVHVRGKWVGYCLDLNTIRARDGARATIGNMIFDAADGLELDIEANTLRGWSVRIRRGEETLEGEDFFYEIGTGRGVIRRFGELGVERTFFSCYSLTGQTAEWELPDDVFRRDDREGVNWMICESCQYHLHQKVVVKKAAFYAQTQKVFSFPPYWVIGLPGYSGSSNTQVVGVSTDGGLAVDFPFFYRVSDNWAGAVKIQRGASGTSFMARDGWSLAVEEEYQTCTTRGSIEASGIFTSDWGVEWRDERTVFGSDQAFFNVAWPDHESIFADASLYHYSDKYRFNLRGQYDDPAAAEKAYRVTGDWLTEPQRLTGNSRYRLGASVGGRLYKQRDDDWVLENELYASVELDPWRIGSRTRIRPTFSDTFSWDTGEFSQNIARAQLRLNHQFGSAAWLGLNYQLSYHNGDSTRKGANSMVGLDFNLTHDCLWNLYLNGTWDVNESDTYGYIGWDWFFKPAWRFGIVGTHYGYGEEDYNDLEFELGRAIGTREIGLRYSLKEDRLSLEFGSFGL